MYTRKTFFYTQIYCDQHNVFQVLCHSINFFYIFFYLPESVPSGAAMKTMPYLLLQATKL